jgi:protein-S-isoprenylcysteine O-methyltransferase Ste14
VAASLLVWDLLLLVSIARPQMRFWPPPERPAWRRRVTRITGPLGPLSVVGILVLGALDRGSFGWSHWSRLAVGGVLFVLGGGFALWGLFGLGVEASQGVRGSLRTDGPYRYSRNPQYVGTVAGLLGYALVCNSTLTLGAWAAWSTWYLMAPFAEEPWLREQLGEAYEEYTTRVRRYL